MTQTTTHPILCIYHANCADGFGAAWVVRKALGPNIEFHPGTYGGQPPDVTGKDVIIVDFSYKYDVLSALARQAHSIIVLDHHKSAADDLVRFEQFHAGIEEDVRQSNGSQLLGWKTAHVFAHSQNCPAIACCFDMNRSGAMLAWDHFFPGQDAPQLLRHIEDRDLWLFKLEGTREIQANLFSYPYDFDVWDQLMASDVTALRADGAAIERKHHKDIAELVGVTKRRLVIGGHDVPAASLPYTLTSDAGELMAQGEPFAACYWDTPTGRVFSLRSTDEGLDVAEIASQYGGGGHRNAAGFRVAFDHPLAGAMAVDFGRIVAERERMEAGLKWETERNALLLAELESSEELDRPDDVYALMSLEAGHRIELLEGLLRAVIESGALGLAIPMGEEIEADICAALKPAAQTNPNPKAHCPHDGICHTSDETCAEAKARIESVMPTEGDSNE